MQDKISKKTVILKLVFHMFRKLEKLLNMLSRDTKDIQKSQIELLETKAIISWKRDTLYGIVEY